ncbi:MAG TPA: hypothetical protein VFE57_07995, partial [Cyclobacteriaceae bacterium]|nr:hypothetical protein [Cyclobacteriaceae bacterium]
PFAFILFAFSLLTMFANAKLRSVFRIITTGYFLTLLTYALTILIVKELNPTEYSEYLYHYTYGKSFKIFTWILVAGILLTMTAALRMNRK